MSSSNIPTIPLTVAQAMNPSPRPPSPTARAATQRAHRRENPHQLSSRDAQVLMGMSPGLGHEIPAASTQNGSGERPKLGSYFTSQSSSSQYESSPPPKKSALSSKATSPKASAPPRPSRETRRKFSTGSQSLDVSATMNLLVGTLLTIWIHADEYRRKTDRVGKLAFT